MDRIYFSEEQKFDQLWFRVILLVSWIPLLVIFGTGIYVQMVLKKPWGNKPMTDSALIVVTLVLFLFMGLLTWLLFSMKLVTEVTEQGFCYRFPPLIGRRKTIRSADIAEYGIRKYNPVREYGGWGVSQSGFGKGVAYNVKGNMGLQLRLHSGKHILFGTQRPDALQAAMDRLMKPTLP